MEFNIVDKDKNNVSINRINNSIRKTCKKVIDLYSSFLDDPSLFYANPEDGVYVVGSVHGLVCFCQNVTYGMFFIWNPVTKMLKTIRKPSGDSSDILRYCRSAFCYDPVDRDFKTIEMERYEMKSELGKILLRFHVYSCNLDTWRVIIDDSCPDSEFYIAGNFKGMLYLKFQSESNVLVAFDVHDGVLKRLPCPEQSVKGSKYYPYPYINWKDSLGIMVYKEPNNPACDKKVVYIYNETRGTWIEQYTTPDSLDPYKLLLGLENGDVVVVENITLNPNQLLLGLENGDDGVEENMKIVKLFEAESSQFKNLTNVSAYDVEVMSYTQSLIGINRMQQL